MRIDPSTIGAQLRRVAIGAARRSRHFRPHGGEEQRFLLDEFLGDGEVRISVASTVKLQAVAERYVVPVRSLRTLINYRASVGTKHVVRKVRSRRAEGRRNAASMEAGVGVVVASRSPGFAAGAVVAFVAPNGTAGSEYVVLSAMLVRAEEPSKASRVGHDWSNHAESAARLSGWTGDCGSPLPLSTLEMSGLIEASCGALSLPSSYSASSQREVRDRVGHGAGRVALFGYGNYAKTLVIPELARVLAIDTIHEIEPLQIGRVRASASLTWDTCPCLRDGEHPEVVFVAGYHHEHASIAIQAIRRGALAVMIEKPLVTSRSQLDELIEVASSHECRVFAGFQRRYSRIMEYLYDDLKTVVGDPISMFSVVYEIDTPKAHWYRHPFSGSAIVSNGCHWLDQFLFVNAFSKPVDASVGLCSDRTIAVAVSLENGAELSLTISNVGSDRLGVRDYTEFRSDGRTARLLDGASYEAESSLGVVRRSKWKKLDAHERMYGSIGRSIVQGTPGDSLQQIEMSCRLMLDVERLVIEARRAPSGARD